MDTANSDSNCHAVLLPGAGRVPSIIRRANRNGLDTYVVPGWRSQQATPADAGQRWTHTGMAGTADPQRYGS